MNNPFWEYSLAVYRQDAVAQHCLALQDRFGVDVNLLLYAAWLGQREQRLDDTHLRELDARIASWREEVVKPLRALRRQLAGNSAANEYREDIKALELRAEQRQQDMMFDYHRNGSELETAPIVILDNLSLAARYSSEQANGWEESVGLLSRALTL